MANYDSKLRQAAAQKVLDGESQAGSRWSCILRVAAEIGCSATTLRRWVRVVDQSRRQAAVRRPSASSRAPLAEVSADPGKGARLGPRRVTGRRDEGDARADGR